jgi:hypothetical protein
MSVIFDYILNALRLEDVTPTYVGNGVLGTTDYVTTYTPTLDVVSGVEITFVPDVANPANATINGAPIYEAEGSTLNPIEANQLVGGGFYKMRYNGTQWVLEGASTTTSIEDWVSGTSYIPYQVVWVENRLQRALTTHTAGASFDLDRANWTVIKELAYGDYQPNIYYYAYEQASSDNRFLRRVTAGTSEGIFDNTEAPTWTLVSQSYPTVWGADTYYYAGELISVGTRLVRRINAGISGSSFDATESSEYTLVRPLDREAFQANTLYYPDEEIVEDFIIYSSFNQRDSGASFDAAEQQEWNYVSTEAYPAGATSQTRTTTFNASVADRIVTVVPAAPMTITFDSVIPEDAEISYAGTIDATNTVTLVAGAGTTIVHPTTFFPVASYTVPGVAGQYYYITLRRLGTVWYLT